MRRITLREARKRRKLDQVALAELAGINQGTVSRLEKGRIFKPTPETVERLEQALRLKPGQLILGAEVAA